MKPEIVEIQSWRYKTIVVIKRQQQTTISNKQSFIAHLFSSMIECIKAWFSADGV